MPATRGPARGATLRRTHAVLAGMALLVTAGGVVALAAPPPGPAPMASPGQSGPLAALAVLVAAGVLLAAGTIAWFGRPGRGLALIAFGAAATWVAQELVGSASVTREARSLGLLIAPLFAPLAVHLPIRALGDDRRTGLMAAAIFVLYLVVAVASVGRSLTYDPFFDVHCSPVCSRGDNVVLTWQDAGLAGTFAALGLAASTVGALVLAAWGWLRLTRANGSHRSVQVVLGASMALGLALAWWSAARLVSHPDLPTEPALLVPALATAVAITIVAAAVAALVWGDIRRAEALRRMAEAIDARSGSPSLRIMLARALADDRLSVVYPLEDGSFIDERGGPVGVPRLGEGRTVTTIERGGDRIALVEHRADLDPELLDREIGAAARVAVDNERLEASIRARLRDLQASRARIVEAGDQARGRLERDLHDGAQQRLLAVSFELRLALGALARAGSVDADAMDEQAEDAQAVVAQAIDELDRALAELRELAHGIHPVVLTEDGLAGALASLAEEAPVPLEIHDEGVGRCAPTTELAAYLAVVEAVRQAASATIELVRVGITQADGWLRLDIAGLTVDDDGAWVRVEDRAGAAGGRLRLSSETPGRLLVSVELPCA